MEEYQKIVQETTEEVRALENQNGYLWKRVHCPMIEETGKEVHGQ